MASLLGAVVRRSFHSSPVTFQFVKDVYKVIGYEAPFSEDQKRKAVEKLNSLPVTELFNHTTKKFSKLIDVHREKNGPFDCVEQLLDLPKVETSHVVKICNSLMSDLSPKTLEEKLADQKKKGNKPLFAMGIIPKPDLKLWEKIENPTIVGVSVTLEGIAYSKIDSLKTHSGWAILPGIDNISSKLSFQQRNLFQIASEIVEKLPDADYYLFEELLPILPKDPYMKHKVNLIKFRTTLITILMTKKADKQVGIHNIKANVLDNLFKLKVGNERTSVQDCLDTIITQTAEGNPFAMRMQISEEAWKTYNECNAQGKEYLASALLKTLSFNHLCHEAESGFE